MKKMNTIHLLPELTSDMTSAERDARFMENWELAATIDFIPDSLETLRAIDYTELRMLMNQNGNFFDAAAELCSDLIENMIKDNKEIATDLLEEGAITKKVYKAIQKAVTLDDLLNSGFYCEDYDTSRDEFVTALLEDYLYKKVSQQAKNREKKETKVENSTVKSMMDINAMNFLSGLLIIANNQAELSADMPLGNFLDWLDEKSKTEDYTSQLIEALQKMD